jgi:hypothetical protein
VRLTEAPMPVALMNVSPWESLKRVVYSAALGSAAISRAPWATDLTMLW